MMFRRDEQVGFRRGRSCTEQVFTLWNICQLRVNNSVYQKPIAEENSDVIAAHCNDHILHNCAKKRTESSIIQCGEFGAKSLF